VGAGAGVSFGIWKSKIAMIVRDARSRKRIFTRRVELSERCGLTYIGESCAFESVGERGREGAYDPALSGVVDEPCLVQFGQAKVMGVEGPRALGEKAAGVEALEGVYSFFRVD
jgi:hypothetical protein